MHVNRVEFVNQRNASYVYSWVSYSYGPIIFGLKQHNNKMMHIKRGAKASCNNVENGNSSCSRSRTTEMYVFCIRISCPKAQTAIFTNII